MKTKPRIICFTYAGGTKAFFETIEEDIPEVDFITPEYAGHGERHREQLYTSFDELSEDIFSMIEDELYGEYALFGYSMGSIVLADILRIILDKSLVPPKALFLAAHEPQPSGEMGQVPSENLDEWVKNRTIEFGSVPEKLVNNRAFWRVYLPVFRADYSIIEHFRFEELNYKTNIPAAVFYSEEDTPLSRMEGWNRLFPCEYYRFDGPHFFINKFHGEIAHIIKNKLGIE